MGDIKHMWITTALMRKQKDIDIDPTLAEIRVECMPNPIERRGLEPQRPGILHLRQPSNAPIVRRHIPHFLRTTAVSVVVF